MLHYAIDVITCAAQAAPAFQDGWRRRVARLSGADGLVCAELFEKQTSIKSADYDFVALSAWDGPAALQEAGAEAALYRAMPGVQVERSVCAMRVKLAELRADAPDQAWLVNPFEVSDAQVPGVLDMWDRAKDYMMQKAGFLNARLFRNIEAGAKYGLINIAQWQSAEAFMAALDNNAYDKHRQESQAYQLHPSLCRRVEVFHPAGAPCAPAQH